MAPSKCWTGNKHLNGVRQLFYLQKICFLFCGKKIFGKNFFIWNLAKKIRKYFCCDAGNLFAQLDLGIKIGGGFFWGLKISFAWWQNICRCRERV
ncbi:MAG: hypothetical protein LBD28_00565 [Tannerellaceae bacterium]|jgi:hypothetical protein|nr:hypothetical protein [Tannerellaceae bacterium]